jgi:hypothetical protein
MVVQTRELVNRALIVLPLGLVLVGVAVWLRPKPAAGTGTAPVSKPPTTMPPPSPEPRPKPDVPATSPSTNPAASVLNPIRTEAGAALNAVRGAQRQLEVLGRAAGVKPAAVGERVKVMRDGLARLRLEVEIDRLGAGPFDPESVKAAREILTRLQEEVRRALEHAALLRGRPELVEVVAISELERDLTALGAAVERALAKLNI